MLKSINSEEEKTTSQNIITDSGSNYQKMTELMKVLKNTANDIQNDWKSKEREEFIYNQILSLEFIKGGDNIINNELCVGKIKEVYKSMNPEDFTTETLTEYFTDIDLNFIYLLKEPFGTQNSPDFLLILKNGILGIEDKSSNNHKISWNTGNPGGNKFIMYYDRKDRKVFLITKKQWNWEDNTIGKQYKELVKGHDYRAERYKNSIAPKVKNTTLFFRAMLIDKNQVKDIWDENEQDVKDMIIKYI